jgi:metal-responsive CopG/Arc/MetJ family transcriptional regulator
MPAKNRMSISFDDHDWALLERLSIHSSKSKSEVVRTIISEYLAENPNRFRRQGLMGPFRTQLMDALPNVRIKKEN